MATLLDVDTRTPHAWFSRKLLPPPEFAAVNGSPAWRSETILRWAAQTNRLPERFVAEYGHLSSGGRVGGRTAKKRFGTESTEYKGPASAEDLLEGSL